MVKFNPDKDIPDLSGRVIIVTGGTDGLGKESVYQLSKHNPAHIYLAARSEAKSKTAIAEIQARPRPTDACCPITFLPLDLSSLESVKSAAQTFQTTSSRLDLLMCNAGVMGAKGTTVEGYETCLGVNHLGHALLIKLLLPTLQRTARDHYGHGQEPGKTAAAAAAADETQLGARVVILASEAEKFAPKSYYTFEEAKTALPQLNLMQRYGQSKVANVHHAQELARHFPERDHGVRVVSVHPGTVFTNLGHDLLSGWPTLAKGLRQVFRVLLGLVPVEEGVLNQLWASVSPDVKDGEFYFPVGLDGKGSPRVKDEEKAKLLWEWTEKELAAYA